MNSAAWLIDQFIHQGVETFAIAPGFRSAPLVHASARAKSVVHFDERGLGFYALGAAKAKGSPVAVITTSGTAAANLLPSVIEAYYSRIPLILITADRSHALRDSGSNQTVDQVKLFSNNIQWQMDLATDLEEKDVRSIAANAVFQAMKTPKGPVHLNCPFSDPLFPLPSSPMRGKPIPLFFPKQMADPVHVKASRGIILLGAVPDPRPVLILAKKLKWPVFADILSHARCFPTDEQILHFDYLIQGANLPKADFLLHFGDRFISKHIFEWEKSVPLMHVSPNPSLQDSSRRISARVQGDISSFSENFTAESDENWCKSWQEIDHRMHKLIENHFQSRPFTEAHLFKSLPENHPIFFGNSMPIRDADHFFFPKEPQLFFCNRGASGIDGNIATAAGLADALERPLIAIIGDLAALHDLNSLPLLKGKCVLLIISNNYGGGIFEHLPVSESTLLETHFAAAHSWTFENAAKMFDIPYFRCEDVPGFWPDFGIMEIISDRKKNASFQKDLRVEFRQFDQKLHAVSPSFFHDPVQGLVRL